MANKKGFWKEMQQLNDSQEIPAVPDDPIEEGPDFTENVPTAIDHFLEENPSARVPITYSNDLTSFQGDMTTGTVFDPVADIQGEPEKMVKVGDMEVIVRVKDRYGKEVALPIEFTAIGRSSEDDLITTLETTGKLDEAIDEKVIEHFKNKSQEVAIKVEENTGK